MYYMGYPLTITDVNPEADPPQPRAPVQPNRAEQDGETAEGKSQEHKRNTSKVHPEDVGPPEESEDVGVTADRSGEKSSKGRKASPAHGNSRQER